MRRLVHDDGMTLVEMLVALIILGIAMTALAGVMVTNVRSVADSQTTQAATNVSLELVEAMHAHAWDDAALYVADTVGADPTTAAWRARLEGDGSFEGLQLVTTPGPTSEADRDPSVPTPSRVVVNDGTDYTLDLYPVWVDRSGDGAVDTKRFVVVATWDDPVLGTRELRTEAERAPKQSEAVSSSSGARFIQASAEPSPVVVDSTDGGIDGFVTVRARTNVGLASNATATLVWREPVLDVDRTLTGFAEVSETITLGNGTFVTGQGYVTFDGRFNGRRGNAGDGDKYRFANGVVDVVLEGTSYLNEPVAGATSFRVTGSPWDDDGSDVVVDPDPDPSDAPSADPTDDPTDDPDGIEYDADPSIRSVVVGDVCVSSNKWRLTSALTFRIAIDEVDAQVGTDPADAGFVPADATVTVTYPYWTAKRGNVGAPDGVDAIAATFRSGTKDLSTWETQVPANDAALFKPGESITFGVTVQRSSDAANDSTTTSAKLVSSSC